MTRLAIAQFAMLGAVVGGAAAGAQQPAAAPAPAAQDPRDPADDQGLTYAQLKLMLRSVDPKTQQVTESHLFRVGHERGAQLKTMLEHVAAVHKVPGLQYGVYEHDHLLVVSGPPDSVAWARELLVALDRPEDMIRIEAVILEVEVGSGIETGLQSDWDRKTSDRTFFRGYDVDFNPDSFLRATSARPFQGATGTFSTKGSPSTQARVGDLDLSIRAVQARNEVRVLSRPVGLVINGGALTLSSGVKILVPKTVSVDAFNNINTQLALETVATKIEAKPHIIGPHTVELDLTVTVQDILRETPPEEIKTSDRIIKTKVVLNEGENLLGLGGLFRKRTQVSETGIPLLSDIPLLGYLFKSYSNTAATFELQVYVRVYIERVDKPEGSERLIIPDDLRKK